MSPQPAQQEQKSALQIYWVPRPQPPLTDSIDAAPLSTAVPLDALVTIHGDNGITAIRGVLRNVGYLGELERRHLLVKLISTPPGPPFVNSLSGLINAGRHPSYPFGLLLEPMRIRPEATYAVEQTEAPWRLGVPLEGVNSSAAMARLFNKDTGIDRFVTAAAAAYYGANPMSETTPKFDSLLFYRQR